MNKKKLIIAIIAIIVCFSMAGCGNNNLENNSVENFTINETRTTFKIENGELKGFNDESKIEDGYELKISKFMEGQEINYIGEDAFKGNDKIVSVTIDGEIGMGNDAFAGCKNLKTVSTLTQGSYIGEGSFKDCESLETVELAMEKTGFHNAQSIPHWAFENCTSLKTVVINGEFERIQQEAFSNCINLESINLTGCEYIGPNAFYNCKKLNVELPADVEISDNAFGMEDNTYIFEKSSEISIKEITNKWLDLSQDLEYSKKELEIAKNEIFARHGHDFSSEELANYFEGQKWYKKIEGKKVSYDELNDIEKANVDLIDRYIQIAIQKEASNGTFVYLQKGYINAYIDRNVDIKDGCKIVASYMDGNEKIEEDIFIISETWSGNRSLLSSIGSVDNKMLDKEVTFSIYSGNSLIAENTLKVENASISFDYYHTIGYKKDGTFTIDSWEKSYQVVDENGRRLKLFDLEKVVGFNIAETEKPFSEVPVFVGELLASDGYLYSYDMYNRENNKIIAKKSSNKKIISYDVSVTAESPSEEYTDYKVNVVFTCEDGSTIEREYLYAPWSIT